MPSNIANALGTERQFMPRPENEYQGRYREIEAPRVFYDPHSQDHSLSQNMAKLSAALSSWDLTHEKHLDQRGFQQAQALVKEMTPEDRRKLGTIDAAQQYGYANDTANPYFRAHVDNLRGIYSAAEMRLMYDEKYANEPAKNMDEEAKRFAEFANEYKKDCYDKLENPHAFDVGYAEKNLENISDLWGKWQKKKRTEDINIAMTDTINKLGELCADAPQIINSAGEEGGILAIGQQAQEAFNTLKLAGVPFEVKQKIAQDWILQMAQTGHMTEGMIQSLVDNVSIQTLISGEDITLSNVINRQDVISAAAAFRKDIMDAETFNLLKEYIESENPLGYINYVNSIVDPEEKKRLAPYISYVAAKSEARKNAREAEARRQAEKERKALEKALQEQVKVDNANTVFNVWMSGSAFMPDGRPISDIKVDKDHLRPLITQAWLNNLKAGNLDNLDRLLAFNNGAASELIGLLKADMQARFNEITLDAWEKDPEGLIQKVENYVKYATARPNTIEAHFGGELAKEARMITMLNDINLGDPKEALRSYAIWKSTPAEEKAEYQKGLEGRIKETVYTIDNMKQLAGGASSDPVLLMDEPAVKNDIVLFASLLEKQGFSKDDALNTAAAHVRDNYREYKGAIFPLSIVSEFGKFTNIGDGGEGLLREALDEYMGDYDKVEYDRSTRSFLFGNRLHLHVSDLYNNALIKARNRGLVLEEAPQVNNTTLTAEDVNAIRTADAEEGRRNAVIDPEDYVQGDLDYEQDLSKMTFDFNIPAMQRISDEDSIPTTSDLLATMLDIYD